jgi:hypothetical protein
MKFFGLIWFLFCVFVAAWVGAMALRAGTLWALVYFCLAALVVMALWRER